MQFTVNGKDFDAAAKRAAKIAPKKTAIPILSCALLQARGDVLTVSATDLDLEVTSRLFGAGTGAAEICVNAHDLAKAAAALKKCAAVTISFGAEVIVSADGAPAFRFPTMAREDFPFLREVKALWGFATTGAELSAALGDVAAAISQEETRYYLNGVFAHVHNGSLRLVATDGHRLEIRDVAAPWVKDDGLAYAATIIPHAAVLRAMEFAKKSAAPVRVAMGAIGQSMAIESGDWRLTSKTIDGSFPEYLRVLPAPPKTTIEIDAARVAEFAKAAAAVGSKCARLYANGRVEFAALAPNETGAGFSQLIEGAKEGDDVTMGLNPAYLGDIVRNLGAVRLEIVDAASPLGIRDLARPECFRVMMPMRLPEAA